MEIIAGIVTYNPDNNRLYQCIRSALCNLKDIIIIDNGSSNINDIKKLCNNHIHLIQNRKNFGIAKALNQIFHYADDNGFDWILTLDQDTIIGSDLINSYIKYLDNSENVNIGIVCPRIHDVISNRIWPEIKNETYFTMVRKCITSGALNNIEAWKKVQGFDEYLFIDEVDNDYCIRLQAFGYSIILLHAAIIEHQIGSTNAIKIFGRKIYIRNHPAERKYYMVRNRLYMDKKIYGYIKNKTVMFTVGFILKTILFEKNKFAKFCASVKGLCDGVKKEVI